MGSSVPESAALGKRLRAPFQAEPLQTSVRKIARNADIYIAGDHDSNVYMIESGQIKTMMLSPDGRECLLAIHVAGDVFGEICLAGGSRCTTATAMKDSIVRQMPGSRFLARLTQNGLLEDFVKYLAARLAEQQLVTTNLVTASSEQRLAATLLQLARKLGKRDPQSLRIEDRISHQELSKMVGTTRSRIGLFMQRFRDLGFIERIGRRALIVKEKPLAAYLEARLGLHGEKTRSDAQ